MLNSNNFKRKIIVISIMIILVLIFFCLAFGLGCCAGCSIHKPIYAAFRKDRTTLIVMDQKDFLAAIEDKRIFMASWKELKEVSFSKSAFDCIEGKIYKYPSGFCSSSALAILRKAPLTETEISALIKKKIVLRNGYITNWKLAKRFLNPAWNAGYIIRVRSFSSDTHFCVLNDATWYNNGASIQWNDVERLSFLSSSCHYDKEIIVNKGII